MSKSAEAVAKIGNGKTTAALADLKQKVLAGNATDSDVNRVEDALNGELANLSNILNSEAGNSLKESKEASEPDNQAAEPDVSVTPEKPKSVDPNVVTADDPSVSPKGDVKDENAPGTVTDPETGQEPSSPLGDDDKEESKSASRRKSAQRKADSK